MHKSNNTILFVVMNPREIFNPSRILPHANYFPLHQGSDHVPSVFYDLSHLTRVFPQQNHKIGFAFNRVHGVSDLHLVHVRCQCFVLIALSARAASTARVKPVRVLPIEEGPYGELQKQTPFRHVRCIQMEFLVRFHLPRVVWEKI